MVIEPLIQGAAGMLIQPPGFLRAVRELCDRYDVLLICDEVATGFGRTGTMFACEQEGVAPDLLCLAKGLTGGYLPLAATLATERIFEAFLGAPEEQRTFFHGHTYTGNPLACAAALANLDAFEREQRSCACSRRSELLGKLLEEFDEMPEVGEIRTRGLMVGIDLGEHDPSLRLGHRVTLEARKRGAIVRPLGDTIVLMPPLSICKGGPAEGGRDRRRVDLGRESPLVAEPQCLRRLHSARRDTLALSGRASARACGGPQPWGAGGSSAFGSVVLLRRGGSTGTGRWKCCC